MEEFRLLSWDPAKADAFAPRLREQIRREERQMADKECLAKIVSKAFQVVVIRC